MLAPRDSRRLVTERRARPPVVNEAEPRDEVLPQAAAPKVRRRRARRLVT